MTSRIGLAVFGLGSIGNIHVKNILTSPRASLKWIVRNKLEEAEKFVKAYDISARCATPAQINDVIDDPSVRGVLICSPSTSHEEIIAASLKGGKTVLCEKPITTEVSSTQACYDLAEKQGCHLLCAFHRRFDPSFRALHERVVSGSLGPLRMVRTSSRDYTPPTADYIKTSGGIFIDTVIHDLDITSWVVGSRPRLVFSRGHAFSDQFAKHGDVDVQVTTVHFENGVIAILDNVRQSLYGYDQRFEAVCEEGMLTVDNPTLNSLSEHGPRVTATPRTGQSYLTRYPQAYANEMEHFLDVLEGKAAPLITKDETLQAMRLAEACKQSCQSGQPLVV
ncbi:uncharacterized oxidoreductase YrbE-like [Liolophura sinensis]|uniref:uncharacterized oxidoreductase YrbE-like n=1 Tax=Liolophura sinensis TaxID=3198878 RepID=UPI00315886D3